MKGKAEEYYDRCQDSKSIFQELRGKQGLRMGPHQLENALSVKDHNHIVAFSLVNIENPLVLHCDIELHLIRACKS